MKKLMTVMLGLSLMGGSAAFVFAQEKQPPTKQDEKNKGKDNKGKDEKGKDEKGGKEKGKGKQ